MEEDDVIYDFGYRTDGAGHNSLNENKESFLNTVVWRFKDNIKKQLIIPAHESYGYTIPEQKIDFYLNKLKPFIFRIYNGSILSIITSNSKYNPNHNRLTIQYIKKYGIVDCEPVGTICYDESFYTFCKYGYYKTNTTNILKNKVNHLIK